MVHQHRSGSRRDPLIGACDPPLVKVGAAPADVRRARRRVGAALAALTGAIWPRPSERVTDGFARGYAAVDFRVATFTAPERVINAYVRPSWHAKATRRAFGSRPSHGDPDASFRRLTDRPRIALARIDGPDGPEYLAIRYPRERVTGWSDAVARDGSRASGSAPERVVFPMVVTAEWPTMVEGNPKGRTRRTRRRRLDQRYVGPERGSTAGPRQFAAVAVHAARVASDPDAGPLAHAVADAILIARGHLGATEREARRERDKARRERAPDHKVRPPLPAPPGFDAHTASDASDAAPRERVAAPEGETRRYLRLAGRV